MRFHSSVALLLLVTFAAVSAQDEKARSLRGLAGGNGNGSDNGQGNGQDNGSGQGNTKKFEQVIGEMEFSGAVIFKLKSEEDLVKKEGKSQAEAKAIRGKAQSELKKQKVKRVEEKLDFVIVDTDGEEENNFIGKLMSSAAAKDGIEFAEPNWTVYPIACPNDPRFGNQWHHNSNLLNSCPAWDIETGSPDVTIAICDTGEDLGHPDLAPGRLYPGYNAVDRKWQNQGGSISNVHPHGTQVAGCAAAVGNNGIGVTGICQKCKHRTMRVTNNSEKGTASMDNLLNAALTAVQAGDRVASVSYSGVTSSAVRSTATQIKRLGGLLVWAAGNNGANLNWGNRDNDDVLVVGATTSSDSRSSFSAYGNSVDVFAPGSSVYTTSPTNNYGAVSGTSFSCPLVAGLAGLIWSADPSLSPDQVENIIKQGADDIGNLGIDGMFGYGRINVQKSLQIASPTPPTPSPPAPAPSSSCMSGKTRVIPETGEEEFQYVKDLTVGDLIEGLDENGKPTSCSIEAIGHFGQGPVYGNYTDDHFILNLSHDAVVKHGAVGKEEVVDKFAVLTSCPVGLDEAGVGFTPVDSDFFGDDNDVSWSDYLLIHKSILRIVRETGQFWFHPSTYTSIGKVRKYTKALYKTMLQCTKNPEECDEFEKAALNLVENSLTNHGKNKAKKGFGNLGNAKKAGSVAAAVTKGKSTGKKTDVHVLPSQ